MGLLGPTGLTGENGFSDQRVKWDYKALLVQLVESPTGELGPTGLEGLTN